MKFVLENNLYAHVYQTERKLKLSELVCRWKAKWAVEGKKLPTFNVATCRGVVFSSYFVWKHKLVVSCRSIHSPRRSFVHFLFGFTSTVPLPKKDTHMHNAHIRRIRCTTSNDDTFMLFIFISASYVIRNYPTSLSHCHLQTTRDLETTFPPQKLIKSFISKKNIVDWPFWLSPGAV